MAEPRLPPLPSGKIKLGAEHFRKVVRRIECIKPLAGEGIKIKQTEDGIEIASDNTQGQGGGSFGGLSGANAVPIELTICANGQPATIYVVGYTSFADVYGDTTTAGTVITADDLANL